MFDKYNTPITFIMQDRFVFQGVPEAHYTYKLYNEHKVESGLTITLTPSSASTFAEFNALTMLKHLD